MKKNSENTNAFLTHIASFAGYIFPLGSIITPLIIWQTQKDKSNFLNNHGKEAVNFNISYALYNIIISASFIGVFFNWVNSSFSSLSLDIPITSFNLWGILGAGFFVTIFTIAKIGLIFIAAMNANEGKEYKYPLTIKFIK